MEKLFFFVRHGQTDYNLKKVIQGQCDRSSLQGTLDLGLNDTGREQALRLAALLTEKKEAFDVILSSDLKRAWETGEILGQALGLPLIPSPGLREMFFGAAWEGRTVEAFKAISFDPPLSFIDAVSGETILVKNGATLREHHKSTDPRYNNIAHPGGETKAEVAARALKALAAFACANPSHDKVLIPTHNGLLRFIMPELGAVEHLEGIRTIFHTETGHLSLLERIKATPAPRTNQEPA